MAKQLDNLFRPFTPGEVADICGAPYFGVIDQIVDSGVLGEECVGDDGTTKGLNIQQAFAAFCATRWLKEGAGQDRAMRLALFVARSDMSTLKAEIDAGRTFPALGAAGPMTDSMMVKPPRSRLGSELNLAKLRLEFFDSLYRVFPDKTTVKTT